MCTTLDFQASGKLLHSSTLYMIQCCIIVWGISDIAQFLVCIRYSSAHYVFNSSTPALAELPIGVELCKGITYRINSCQVPI